MNKKTAVLLVNLGTPDSPATSDVRKYLKQFLLDARVIDIPTLQRQLLVRGIIAPFRSPKSAATYRKIWHAQEGSPLLYHSKAAMEKLRAQYAQEDTDIYLAMRYQSPSIESQLEMIRKKSYSQIIVFPLFPQYASATTGSIQEEVMRLVARWQVIPNMTFIMDFFQHPLFIQSIVDIVKSKFDLSEYDHFLFSYHGLPQRQLLKADVNKVCLQSKDCCATYNSQNRNCYSAQCYETTRLIVEALQIKDSSYTTCFQSRLGRDPWVQPYTSEVLKEKAAQGIKKILCFSPAFVADCLETIYEVAMEYDEEFKHLGGEKVDLVPSLNDSDTWISCMNALIEQHKIK